MSIFGPPNVGKLVEKRDIKGLLKALSYPKDAEVRRKAAEALGDIADPQAVESLLIAIKDESAAVRAQAASALGSIGDPRSLDMLISALKDSEPSVRRATMWALHALGDSRSVQPLIQALNDPDPDARFVAVSVLGELADARATAALTAALNDPGSDIQSMAGEALGKIGGQAADSLYRAALQADAGTRQAAAVGLEYLKEDKAQNQLAVMLADPDPHVRRSAASSLGTGGLLAALHSPSEYLQECASAGLVSKGTEGWDDSYARTIVFSSLKEDEEQRKVRAKILLEASQANSSVMLQVFQTAMAFPWPAQTSSSAAALIQRISKLDGDIFQAAAAGRALVPQVIEAMIGLSGLAEQSLPEDQQLRKLISEARDEEAVAIFQNQTGAAVESARLAIQGLRVSR